MKKLSTFITSILLANILLANAWEGKIETKYYDSQTNIESKLVWHITNEKIALDIESEVENGKYFVRFIADKSNQEEMLMLATSPDGMKFKQTIKTADVKSALVNSTYKVEQTDKNHEILGVSVQLFIATDRMTKNAINLSKDINVNWSEFKAFFKNDPTILALAENGINGFPINATITNAGGNLISSSEVVKISTLDRSVFQVSSEYKEYNLETSGNKVTAE